MPSTYCGLSPSGMTTKFITAKQDNVSTPLPLEEEKLNTDCKYRIWIGNVDPLVTEYVVFLFEILQLYKSWFQQL